jgi:RND family efflux transporter MFP subunit
MRLFGLLAAAFMGFSAQAQQAGGPPKRPPAVVTLAPAKLSALPFRIDALGSVQPVATVAVRSRVDAHVESIAIADGATVKVGDLLVKLDSRQIEAQLKQAQAQLARDKAQLEQNERDVARFSQLVASKSGTQVNYDNARTAVASTKAAIAGDEAVIENLKVQLSYYQLRAPISGRAGVFNQKVGNIVRALDNSATGVIVTINQMSPIYIAVSAPQRYLQDLRAAIAGEGALVEARPQGGQKWIAGKVSVIDNTIDPATGMIIVRAIFNNEDETLWPGQLCDLRVTLRQDQNLVVVPREAVQVGQRGSFVFVAEGGVAKSRNVELGREQDGLVVIQNGVKPGEQLVVGGASMLANDAAITVAPAAPATAESPKPDTAKPDTAKTDAAKPEAKSKGGA